MIDDMREALETIQRHIEHYQGEANNPLYHDASQAANVASQLQHAYAIFEACAREVEAYRYINE